MKKKKKEMGLKKPIVLIKGIIGFFRYISKPLTFLAQFRIKEKSRYLMQRY